ncbi:hypothetical protein, partial [Salmonella enterica]|uniref:hypothetical protein n=3 Tax=Salmonella TaxID=590 RepID=UPI00300535CA
MNSHEDFGCFNGVVQGEIASKNRHFAQEWSERDEKSTNRKKDPKNACAKKWDPYNAPPLTRNNGTQAAGSAGFRPEPHGEK